MDRGTYAAASAGIAQLQKLDVVNNNLANVNTAGFKRQLMVGRTQSFDDTLAKEVAAEERLLNRARFWVAFPVGLITMAAGFFLRPVAVGSGLAFGGLCTLASGCYS